MDNAFDFYTKPQYFAELEARITATKPGGRVLLMSMDFEPERPEIASLMATLQAAAERGVHVSLGIDAHSFLSDGGRLGPLWYHESIAQNVRQPYRLKYDLLQQLGSHHNAQVVILNRPHRFSLPIAGRSHIKAAILDDYVILGGCNLDNPAHVDLMAGWQDAQDANALRDVLQAILTDGSARHSLQDTDQTLALTAGTLYIDAGVRNQSLIFEQALALIDSAQQWLTITCQFFPNSITAEHLYQATKRGVKVEILYTHSRQHSAIGRLGQQLSEAIEHSRLPRSMFAGQLPASGPYLHAKLIACDTGMLLGSHNYVRAGVRLGTAEIALLVSNQQIAAQAAAKIHAELSAV